jgi:6-phosphogluconolactonase
MAVVGWSCESNDAESGLSCMSGWFLVAGKGELSIFGNGKAVADFAVERWMEACRESVANKGYFAAALSGGRTPIDFYKLLSARGNRLPWKKTHIFLADERFVPATDEESNYRLVRECLLHHGDIPKNNVHRIDTEEATLEMAAEKYEEEIRGFFGIEPDCIPEFDLIMLGIGEDGHTASLFPGAPSLQEEKRVAIPVVAEKPPHKRISLTLPVLINARRILFLVTGSEKAGIVREIVEDSESRLPASLVRRMARSVYLVMDEGAASLLSSTRG